MTTQCEQEKAYNRYIRDHQHNVGIAWRLIRPDFNNNPGLQKEMDKIISVHDFSKFSKEEFPGYREKFYPADGEVCNHQAFIQAWNHHQKANPHHWEYWVMTDGKPLEMPLVRVLEMLCDWGAMDIYYQGNLLKWYVDHQGGMVLHANTEILILEHIANVAAKVQEYNNGGAQYANNLPN